MIVNKLYSQAFLNESKSEIKPIAINMCPIPATPEIEALNPFEILIAKT